MIIVFIFKTETPMQTLKSLNWNWSAIVALLFAVGIVGTNDPALAAISLAGMAIVALLNFMARSFGIRIGAGWLTIGLYVVSGVLAYFLSPIPFPALPEYGGDPALFAEAVAGFVSALGPLAGTLMASATLVYNALKPLVFDKYLPAVEPPGTKPEEIVG